MSTMPYSSAVMNSLHSTLPDLPSYVAERSIFFSGEHSGKAFSLGVVKRSDNIPVHEKPKMPWEIDLFIELAQGGGGGLNLINITCGIERLAEILHRSLGLLGGLLGGAGFQHVRHGVASEFHAGIIDQSRDQFICQLRVGFLDELKGQSTCARFCFWSAIKSSSACCGSLPPRSAMVSTAARSQLADNGEESFMARRISGSAAASACASDFQALAAAVLPWPSGPTARWF